MKIHQLAFLFLCAVLMNASAQQSTPDTPAKAPEPKASKKSPKAAPSPEGKSSKEPEGKDKDQDKDDKDKDGKGKPADPMCSGVFMGMNPPNAAPSRVPRPCVPTP